ncbi:hypothetical protein J2X09_004303 [Hydrogenophaga laconesensis]|uniref:Uncharacterized protein n=1 Tax=Hydrogenophaga laconesensis TaxID=1805971 RepID=A0ABU1VGE7_9BURK|nr:hypothetical protein [Hydrogenophaga laconesensis]
MKKPGAAKSETGNLPFSGIFKAPAIWNKSALGVSINGMAWFDSSLPRAAKTGFPGVPRAML